MELFVIQCVTCHARLKVHDPALVGDVIECPKCSSFVQVTAPVGWQAPTGLPAAPPVAARPAPTKIASGNTTNPAPMKAAGTSSFNISASNITSASTVVPGAMTPPLVSAPPVAKAAAAPASKPPVAPPPLPGAPLTKVATAGAKAPAKVAAPSRGSPSSGLTPSGLIVPELATTDGPGLLGRVLSLAKAHWRLGLISAGGAALFASVLLLVFGMGKQPDVAQTEVSQLAGQAPIAETADAAPAAEDPAADTASESATETPAADTSPTADATEPADSPAPAEETAPTDSEQNDVAMPGPPSLPTPDDTAAADPLEAAVNALAPTTPPKTVPAAAETPPAELTTDNEPAEEFDPVRQAKLMSHLSDSLAPIEFSNVSLGQFVAFLSEFSTVPIELDSKSLLEAGKGAKTRISVKLTDATVEQALKAALAKPGLAYHVEPGRLVITAGKPPAK